MRATTLVFCLIGLFVISSLAVPTYLTNQFQVTTSVTVDIYHPVCPLGETDCDNSQTNGAPFPTIVIGQDANTKAEFYSTVGASLARLGFVVAVPNAPLVDVLGNPARLTSPQVLLEAAQVVHGQNDTFSSPIFGKADTNNVFILGHGHGGYAGLLAGSSNGDDICNDDATFANFFCDGWNGVFPGLKGVALFAGAAFAPSRVGDPTPSNSLPVMLQEAQLDGLTDVADIINTYNVLNPPKSQVRILGANHYGITDVNNPDGAIGDDSPQTLSQSTTISRISLVTRIFIKGVLGHEGASNQLYTSKQLPNTNSVVVNSQKA